jgi:outer membrane translocation and assembly module TamA
MNRALRTLLACALAGLASTGCTSIPEGRSAIDSVSVVGPTTLSRADVLDKLATTATPRFLGLMRGVVLDYEILDASMLQRDLARLERYYRGHGFLDAHARAARVVHVSANHVRVEIEVVEGSPTLVRTVRIDGLAELPAPVADAVRTDAAAALPVGARFDEDAYAKAKTAITLALTDRGYAYASVQADAQVDLAAHVIDYAFTVHPGIRAVFGRITIVDTQPAEAGKTSQFAKPLDEAPLRRALDIQEGAEYSTKAIAAGTQALLDLGVLASVQIVPTLADPPAPVVPLTVKVEPATLHVIKYGGGFELDDIKTEVHAVVGYEDHNFYGGLRSLSLEFQPGVVLYPTRFDHFVEPSNFLLEERTRLQLTQPGLFEAHTKGFVKPEINVFPMLVEPNPDPSQPVVGYFEPKIAFGVERRFFTHLITSLSYNVQGEVPFFYPTGVDTTGTALPPPMLLLFPQLTTTLDFRDNPLHPHKGFYLSNDLTVAYPGTAYDVRIQPDARAYVPLGRRVTLAAHAGLGLLFSSNYGEYIQNLKEIGQQIVPNPLSKGLPGDPGPQALDHVVDRDIEIVYFRGFFLGGPDSNRGFPLRGIAPHGVVPFLSPANESLLVQANCVPGQPGYNPLNCSIPIGGFTMWQASLEARFDIVGPFGAAVFCDAGDVSAKPYDVRFKYLHLSCGAGARYDTPVGPIRLDVGYRIPFLQVLGYANENDIFYGTPGHPGDPTQGLQPTFLGQPLALSFGIGESF